MDCNAIESNVFTVEDPEERDWKPTDQVNQDLSYEALFDHETLSARFNSSIPYHLQGDRKFDTPRTKERRVSFTKDFRIVDAVAKFWAVFTGEQKIFKKNNKNRMEKCISKEEYINVHMKMNKALRRDIEFEEAAAKSLALEDFKTDARNSQFDDYINFGDYYKSMFDLADIWTPSVKEIHYVEFLHKLFHRITRPLNLELDISSDDTDDSDSYTPGTSSSRRVYKKVEAIIPFKEDELKIEEKEKEIPLDLKDSSRSSKQLRPSLPMIFDRDSSDMSTISSEPPTPQVAEPSPPRQNPEIHRRGPNLSRQPTRSRLDRKFKNPMDDLGELEIIPPHRRMLTRQPTKSELRWLKREPAKTRKVYEYLSESLGKLTDMKPVAASQCLMKVISYLFDKGKIDDSQKVMLANMVKGAKAKNSKERKRNGTSLSFMQKVMSSLLEDTPEEEAKSKQNSKETKEFNSLADHVSRIIHNLERKKTLKSVATAALASRKFFRRVNPSPLEKFPVGIIPGLTISKTSKALARDPAAVVTCKSPSENSSDPDIRCEDDRSKIDRDELIKTYLNVENKKNESPVTSKIKPSKNITQPLPTFSVAKLGKNPAAGVPSVEASKRKVLKAQNDSKKPVRKIKYIGITLPKAFIPPPRLNDKLTHLAQSSSSSTSTGSDVHFPPI